MDRVLPTVTPPATVTDGFGQRTTGVDSESGDQVELLEFAPEIVEHSGFVTALAERVARFSTVRHASYVHLRRLDRPSADRLQLVSELTPGWRLSEMLEESAAANVPIDITVVIALLRQLVPAVALFGRHNRENAIGALSPHRLIVTPQARLVIAEHAFGPAIEKLNFGRDKLWRDFRVSMPPSAGLPRANPRADANAIGIVALTLLLGRSLELDEFPSQLETLVENAQEHRNRKAAPVSASFKNWLKRALQFDVATAFQSPSEAQLAFESVLASDRSYVTNSPVFANWVNEIGGAIDIKRTPAPAETADAEAVEPQQDESGEAGEDVAVAPPVASEPANDVVIVRSNGEVATEPVAQPDRAREQTDELRRRLELSARPQPVPEPEEVAIVPEPVEEIVAPEPVVMTAPEVVEEEIEVPLDEPEVAVEPVAAAAAEPAVEAEAETYVEPQAVPEPEPEPEPESAPEPEPVPPPRPAFTRQQLEEDPIARALLTYQPKPDPPAAPPPPMPSPEPEPEPEVASVPEEAVEEPVAEVVEEPVEEVVEEPVQEVVEEPVPEVQEVVEAPEPVQEPAPQYEAPPIAARKQTWSEPAPVEEAVEEEEEEEEEQYQPPPQYVPPQMPAQQATAYDAAPVVEPARFESVPAPSPEPSPKEDFEDDEPRKGPFANPLVLGLAGVVVLLVAAMGWLLMRPSDTGGMRAGEGQLVVQSRPEGAQVKVDGQVKGNTPLTISLDAGAHVMEVQSGKSEPRVIPLTITAGVQTSQYVELQGVARTGSLEIRSEPAGARITIDGRPRGTTPMTVGDLTPGDHTVVLEAGSRKASQTVRIEAGATQQLVVPMRR